MDEPDRRVRRAPRLAIVLAMAVAAGVGLAWWMARDATEDEGAGAPADLRAPPVGELDARRFGEPVGELLGDTLPLTPGRGATLPTVPVPADLQATTLVGRVVRPEGPPVVGACVILGSSHHAIHRALRDLLDTNEPERVRDLRPVVETTWGSAYRGTSGTDGGFRIPLDSGAIHRLGGGRLLVAAVGGRGDCAVQKCDPLGPHETPASDIILPHCAAVRLRIVTPDGSIPELSQVRVEGPQRLGPFPASIDSWLRHGWLGADGRAELRGLLPGTARILVDVPGARLVSHLDVELVADQCIDLGDVLLEAGERITGFVETADGSAVSEVQVGVVAEVEPSPERHGGTEVVGRRDQWVRTGVGGRFDVGGLDPGTYALHAEAPGFLPADLEGVAAGQRDVRLVLERPASVLLWVLDATSRSAIETAEISVVGLPPQQRRRWNPPVDAQIVTGVEHGLQAGLYRITGATPAGTRLTVRAQGYAPANVLVPPLAPQSEWTERLVLVPGLTVRGRVTDRRDRPIEGATVRLVARDQSLSLLGSPTARAEADGRFALTELPAGNWQCSADADGYFATARVEIDVSRDVDDVLVRLTPVGRIEGRVLDARGDPVAAGCTVASVLIEPTAVADAPPYTPQVLVESDVRSADEVVQTGVDGTYALDGLAPGDQIIGAARLPPPVHESWLETSKAAAVEGALELSPSLQRVRLTEGERRTLDLVEQPLATLRGRVLVDGAPAANAMVTVAPAQGAEFRWEAGAEAPCDASGRYELGGLVPGRALVLAIVESELLPRAERVLLSAGQATTLDLDFRGISVRGRTIDRRTRQSVANVDLLVWWTPPADETTLPAGVPSRAVWDLCRQRARISRTASDESGGFEFRRLPPGHYGLRVGPGWIAGAVPSFDVDETWSVDDLVVEVETGAVVEGRFRIAGDDSALESRHYQVGLYHPTENTVFAFTDVQGDGYRLQGLSGGSYVLRVRRMDAPEPAGFEQVLELGEDETRRIDIVIDA